MSTGDIKIILKESILFSLVLAVFGVLSSMLLVHLTQGVSQSDKIGLNVNWIWIETFFQIGFVSWYILRIYKRLEKSNYWSLVIGTLVLLLIQYHVSFVADYVYFYVTHPNYKPETGNTLEMLLSLFTGRNEVPPTYNIIRSFFAFFMDLKYMKNDTVISFLIRLIFNPICLSFWLSWIVWTLKNRRKNSTITQSTPDIE